MTWQRIDENTYIDDTLVTCAEYQLFIDEMRDQGKYSQPDHWTSYQFPVGQAREPILGARHSDAVTFCEWLTQRVGEEWTYHLPSRKEAEGFPYKRIEHAQSGYWLRINELDRFFWIGAIPQNARRIELDIIRARGAEFGYRFSYNDLDVLDGRVSYNSGRPLYLEPDGSHYFSESLICRYIPPADYTGPNQYDKVFADVLSRRLESGSHSLIDLALGRAFVGFSGLDGIAVGTSVFIDLFTLQERIAGRSPAFEGIRLVKERIR